MRRSQSCTYDADGANETTSEDDLDLKTNPDVNFTLCRKMYPLKAFVPEEIYTGRLHK